MTRIHLSAVRPRRLTSSRAVQSLLCLQEQPRYEEFYGLFVTDAWIVRRCVCAFIGTTVLVVPGFKVLLGSWEAAFTAGSFILAIPMVAFAALGCSK